jgi:acyl carrier protein
VFLSLSIHNSLSAIQKNLTFASYIHEIGFIMAKITGNIENEVKEIVYKFFAEECEVDIASMNDSTNIIRDIDGDSLMFLELIEIFKKKYNLDIELKTIGKYAVKHPVQTIGELIGMQMMIIQHENKLLDFDK